MLSNADIKLIQSLKKKKYRKIKGLFVIEGVRLVHDAVLSNCVIKSVYVTDVFLNKKDYENLIQMISKNSFPFNTITAKEMISIANTITPSGILALCKIPAQNDFNEQNTDNWLYLDEIKDPGNLGTLLRSAAWFGIKNVALSNNCIDVYNPKVLRGGMGAHFLLNIYENIPLESFNNHLKIGAFQDGKSFYQIDTISIEPWALVIGSEAHGISKNNINIIDEKITIPQIGSGESLNAAVAGSILLYHLTAPLLSDQ